MSQVELQPGGGGETVECGPCPPQAGKNLGLKKNPVNFFYVEDFIDFFVGI